MEMKITSGIDLLSMKRKSMVNIKSRKIEVSRHTVILGRSIDWTKCSVSQ